MMWTPSTPAAKVSIELELCYIDTRRKANGCRTTDEMLMGGAIIFEDQLHRRSRRTGLGRSPETALRNTVRHLLIHPPKPTS